VSRLSRSAVHGLHHDLAIALAMPFTLIRRLLDLAKGLRVLGAAVACGTGSALAATAAEPPGHLRDTGLYRPGSSTEVWPENLPFTPQYPLWSDGTRKRRWLYLPPGTAIDASRPDAWQFPPGTRVWKEFAYDRPIETRYIERRADGSWLYATYVWNANGSDAVLAPDRGIRALPVTAAPGGRYEVPARADCLACHEGAAAPLLSVSALQLSPDRDPLAAHGGAAAPGELDLAALVARGWLRNLPPALQQRAPRIAAASPTERAALGYLHGNCGHCHNDNGAPVPVKLQLAQTVAPGTAGAERVLASLINAPTRYRPAAGADHAVLVAPGRPEDSVLALRMASRQPLMQMPPLGSRHPDARGLSLIERWITHDLPSRRPPKETPP
jgi:hypothetical protein